MSQRVYKKSICDGKKLHLKGPKMGATWPRNHCAPSLINSAQENLGKGRGQLSISESGKECWRWHKQSENHYECKNAIKKIYFVELKLHFFLLLSSEYSLWSEFSSWHNKRLKLQYQPSRFDNEWIVKSKAIQIHQDDRKHI